jgi:hypothetical protein
VKRYLLFEFWSYYPEGGWNDFKGSFDTVAEAEAATEIEIKQHGNSQIIDGLTGEKVGGF